MPEDLEKEIKVAEMKAESMLKELEKIEGTKAIAPIVGFPSSIPQKICIDEETFKEIKTIAENYESEGGDLSQYPKASKLIKR